MTPSPTSKIQLWNDLNWFCFPFEAKVKIKSSTAHFANSSDIPERVPEQAAKDNPSRVLVLLSVPDAAISSRLAVSVSVVSL